MRYKIQMLLIAITVKSVSALADGPICNNPKDCNSLGSASTLVGGPTGTTMGSNLTSKDQARMMLLNQAAPDAAEFLTGAQKSEILTEAINELRAERRAAGDESEVTDTQLAELIIETVAR